ncbi:MAG: rhomboid family intramembrane serine protease [Deltaproteobacteria bacterium]|nr:rhomboid family intramembrane serine protease [Deltaproteobacteria bacterium]
MLRFPPLTPLTKFLLLLLFGVYLAEIIAENWLGVPAFALLSLNAVNPGLPTLWQPLTYAFAWPTDTEHLFSMLLTLLFLWWMVPPFEQSFGRRRTIQLLITTTLSAALLALVAGLFFSGAAPLYGAGSALLGLIAAFAWAFRHRGQMSFFGVLPMKPVNIIYIALGFSVLVFLMTKDFVGLMADLGAIGGGVLFAEWMSAPKKPKKPKKRRKGGPDLHVVDGRDGPRWIN